MAEVRIVFDQGQISFRAPDDANVIAAMEYLSGKALLEMKARCPVFPVHPVYAMRGPDGGGRAQAGGDFPALASGFLRSSGRRLREPDGGYIIGPTASSALYVNNGTPLHLARPVPLRHKATGQVFGRVVHYRHQVISVYHRIAPGHRGAVVWR